MVEALQHYLGLILLVQQVDWLFYHPNNPVIQGGWLEIPYIQMNVLMGISFIGVRSFKCKVTCTKIRCCIIGDPEYTHEQCSKSLSHSMNPGWFI